MLLSLQVRAAAIGLGVLVACVGCQSAAPAGTGVAGAPPGSPTPSPSPEIVGPVLTGTVSISGAAHIPTTHFVTGAQLDAGQMQIAPPAGATCADYADGFANAPGVVPLSFVAPLIQTSGDHSIYVGVTMTAGYAGPGTYDSEHAASLSGDAVEGIGAGTAAVYTVFHSKDSGALTLTVNADGSGSLQIEHWDSDEVRQDAGASQVNISGVVTWVCQS